MGPIGGGGRNLLPWVFIDGVVDGHRVSQASTAVLVGIVVLVLAGVTVGVDSAVPVFYAGHGALASVTLRRDRVSGVIDLGDTADRATDRLSIVGQM